MSSNEELTARVRKAVRGKVDEKIGPIWRDNVRTEVVNEVADEITEAVMDVVLNDRLASYMRSLRIAEED